MASNTQQKKMEYKKVKFDVNEILPDAPAGEWEAIIPRGKCKIQPTKDDHFPMIIVPIRLEKTQEEGEEYEKALGTELSTFLVFGAKTPRGEKLSKLRIRQICEAADVDLDLIPKEIGDDPDSELEPLIRALEGKKFPIWTALKERKDTGEITSEIFFSDPNRRLTAGDDEEEEEESAPRASRSSSPKKKNGKRK